MGRFWFLSLQLGSVDAEAALGSALSTAAPALPSHGSDSFVSDEPLLSTPPELSAFAGE